MIDNDVKIKEKCLAISIDIRNSTNFHKKYGIKKSAQIVSDFMAECSAKMTKQDKFFSNFIYAGDGIIGICYADDNEKAFDQMFEISLNIKKIIINYEKYFDAGIGMDYGQTAIIKVKNVQKNKNNTLYTGDSVSTAAKFCKLMPFKNKIRNEKKYIGLSKEFYKQLSPNNKNKCQKTKTKYIEKSIK